MVVKLEAAIGWIFSEAEGSASILDCFLGDDELS
jgi:hypothetical protein